MLTHKLYFTILLLVCPSPNFTNDFYSKFHQKDYKIEFQRVELTNYSQSVYNFFEIKTCKYNRTFPVTNYSFNSKVNMSTEVEMAVQFYKFLSNEYRKLPGTNFQINYCKGINTNIMGLQSVFKCGNFTSCVVVAGTTYAVCNYYPDESRFPPLFPNGEFKLQTNLIYKDKVIVSFAMYIKVYRPITIPRSYKTVS